MTGSDVLQELRASSGPAAGVGKPVGSSAEMFPRQLEHLASVRRQLSELPEPPRSERQEVDRLVSPGLPQVSARYGGTGRPERRPGAGGVR